MSKERTEWLLVAVLMVMAVVLTVVGVAVVLHSGKPETRVERIGR